MSWERKHGGKVDSMNLGRLTHTLAGCQLRTLKLNKPLCLPGASLCHLVSWEAEWADNKTMVLSSSSPLSFKTCSTIVHCLPYPPCPSTNTHTTLHYCSSILNPLILTSLAKITRPKFITKSLLMSFASSLSKKLNLPFMWVTPKSSSHLSSHLQLFLTNLLNLPSQSKLYNLTWYLI